MCGLPHPDFLLPYMTGAQLKEAELYHQVEPYGELQQFYQAALICCIIANANRDTKKKPEPFKVEDFMPQFEEIDKQAQMKKVLTAMATKKVKREDKDG